MQGLGEEIELAQNTCEGFQMKLERSRRYSKTSYSRTWRVWQNPSMQPRLEMPSVPIYYAANVQQVKGADRPAGPGRCGMPVCAILLETVVVFHAAHYNYAVRWNNYVGKSAYRHCSRADMCTAECLHYVVEDVTLILNTKPWWPC